MFKLNDIVIVHNPDLNRGGCIDTLLNKIGIIKRITPKDKYQTFMVSFKEEYNGTNKYDKEFPYVRWFCKDEIKLFKEYKPFNLRDR